MCPSMRAVLSRRTVLDRLLGAWAAGVVGSILYPVVRYLVPPDVPEAATATVSGGSAASLAPNSGRIVPFGSAPVLLVRTPAGELRAFSATCTHLDCTVQYPAGFRARLVRVSQRPLRSRRTQHRRPAAPAADPVRHQSQRG